MTYCILLVDDDDDFRKAVLDILEMEEYKVIDINDGIHAEDILKKEKIDLVITDILMPEMDGNQLGKMIRASNPNLPIIGMTGGGRYQDAENTKQICVKSFFNCILTKPYPAKDLIEAVKAVLL